MSESKDCKSGPGDTCGLWRYTSMGGCKYLVQRRDGSVPEWPYFVLGARDPAAQVALDAYAAEAERLGFDPKYVSDVRRLADDFGDYLKNHGKGNPDGIPHRRDDPVVVEKMIRAGIGNSAQEPLESPPPAKMAEEARRDSRLKPCLLVDIYDTMNPWIPGVGEIAKMVLEHGGLDTITVMPEDHVYDPMAKQFEPIHAYLRSLGAKAGDVVVLRSEEP